MKNTVENDDKGQFANGQNRRDLRVSMDAAELETQLDIRRHLRGRTDSTDRLVALRKGPSEDLDDRRIELPGGAER